MHVTQILCDRCGQTLKERGYTLARASDQAPLTIAPWCGPGSALDRVRRHFCGKGCLLRELSDTLDPLPASPVPKPAGSSVEPPEDQDLWAELVPR